MGIGGIFIIIIFFYGDIYYLYDMIYNYNVVKSRFYFYLNFFFFFGLRKIFPRAKELPPHLI